MLYTNTSGDLAGLDSFRLPRLLETEILVLSALRVNNLNVPIGCQGLGRGCTGLRPAQLEGRGPVAPRKARTGIQDNIFSPSFGPNFRRLFLNKPTTAAVVFLTGLLIPSPISPDENKIRVSLFQKEQNCWDYATPDSFLRDEDFLYVGFSVE